MFGLKKVNGYKSNNHEIDPEVKMQIEKFYFKFYPTNEKITNNEFGHKLCWGLWQNERLYPLVENPPFCNYIFNCCSITIIVANYFSQLGNVFFNYQPARSINTS
jgi:hypothetical protein